ncbi:MAG TPA: polysaccharide biosynthesis tyrosine autokinase [Chthoniobacteraceae bacterium]|nr:polysaccharide biosynthesis tyrosine autokinase [Chthoniobacteraceae bacterium]
MPIPFSNPQGGAQSQADLLSELMGGKPGGRQTSFGGMVLRYAEILRRGWWVMVLTAAIALGVAAWYIFQKAPDYQSTGRILISGRISLPGSQGEVYSQELGNYFGDQVELMQSQIVQDKTRDHVLAEHPGMKDMKVKLEVKQQPQASILILNAISSSSAYSQAYLDALMEEYENTKKEMHLQTSQTTLTAITGELKTLESSLQDDEAELLNFRKENNIGYLQEEGTSAGTYLAGLEKKLATLKTEYDLLSRLGVDQNIDRRSQGTLDESVPLVQGEVTGQTGPLADYIKAKQQIALLQARIADYSINLKPKHPIIVGLTNQITLQKRLMDAYLDQIKSQLDAEKQSYQVQIENTEQQIKEWQTKALDLSERMATYDKLKAKYDRSKDLYDRLLTSLQSVDVNKNIDQDIVTILEKASPPKPIKLGMPAAFGGALLIGLLAGFGILILHDQVDDKLKSTRNFQEHFSEPIIGRVAYEPEPANVLAGEDSRHAFAESFSNLRSSLLYLPYKNGRPKSLLVTSAQPNEGKSTVASNLAVSLSVAGSKVLLVDADLRRGRVAEIFNLPNGRGLSTILMGQLGIRDAILRGSEPNLDIVPRGKAISHPGRYLLGQTMDRFVAEMKGLYDYIIFDSCPILAADDTTSLAPKLDATLFVVRIGASSMHASRKSLELLYDRQVNVLGAVLNVVPSTGEEYSYYNYAGYYNKKESEAV